MSASVALRLATVLLAIALLLAMVVIVSLAGCEEAGPSDLGGRWCAHGSRAMTPLDDALPLEVSVGDRHAEARRALAGPYRASLCVWVRAGLVAAPEVTVDLDGEPAGAGLAGLSGAEPQGLHCDGRLRRTETGFVVETPTCRRYAEGGSSSCDLDVARFEVTLHADGATLAAFDARYPSGGCSAWQTRAIHVGPSRLLPTE